MAETAFVTDHHLPGQTAAGFLRRVMNAMAFSLAELGTAIADARSELRLHQAMRGFDQAQLRDIGLDRDAC